RRGVQEVRHPVSGGAAMTRFLLLAAAVLGCLAAPLVSAPPEKPPSPQFGFRSSYLALTFRPDGKTVAAGGANAIELCDASSEKRTDPIFIPDEVGRGLVYGVAFSPDGKMLASGGEHVIDNERVILMWDLKTKKVTAKLKGDRGVIGSIAFSPDGNLLASGASHY